MYILLLGQYRNLMSSSSGKQKVVFEDVKRGTDANANWKYRLPEINAVCSGLTQASVNLAFGVTEIMAYILDSQNKIKAFAFLYPLKSGRGVDNKVKSVNFLMLKIICARTQGTGHGTRMMREIETYAKTHGFEYVVIEEPIESARAFYSKLKYDYIGYGTVDGVKVFDSCWKKL